MNFSYVFLVDGVTNTFINSAGLKIMTNNNSCTFMSGCTIRLKLKFANKTSMFVNRKQTIIR